MARDPHPTWRCRNCGYRNWEAVFFCRHCFRGTKPHDPVPGGRNGTCTMCGRRLSETELDSARRGRY